MDYRENYITELKDAINPNFKKEINDSDGTTFDKIRSINQELSFGYAERYFKESNVPFKENNKKTLGLIDEDGYYTNVALVA